MSNLLPKEGTTPDQLVPVPRTRPARPTPAPVPLEAPTLLRLSQFAGVRKLKNARPGFESWCKQKGITDRRTLKEWDELFVSYWNCPVRG